MSQRARFRRAVGISYDGATSRSDGNQAPSVSIKADQLRADEVVRIARRFGIPVQEDAALARSLSALEVDQQIPAALFEAVALVLAELDRSLTQATGKSRASAPRGLTIPSSASQTK